jgi:hypothetical protein
LKLNSIFLTHRILIKFILLQIIFLVRDGDGSSTPATTPAATATTDAQWIIIIAVHSNQF